MISAVFVKEWSEKYPKDYDDKFYCPYINNARKGDEKALRKVTEWKNVGTGRNPKPINFENHKYKNSAFVSFLKNFKSYKCQGGQNKLKEDYKNKAPVWSIFWHHVLYGTPIFDRYTNIVFYYLDRKNKEVKNIPKIPGNSTRWKLYDEYCQWFNETLLHIKKENEKFTDRDLDRALVMFGASLASQEKKKSKTTQCK